MLSITPLDFATRVSKRPWNSGFAVHGATSVQKIHPTWDFRSKRAISANDDVSVRERPRGGTSQHRSLGDGEVAFIV
uniref:Uncharacterized protein n=1 Tax=mine drainage metagenome TaxID=410659 RepID=E6Q3A0_9ZZZZ